MVVAAVAVCWPPSSGAVGRAWCCSLRWRLRAHRRCAWADGLPCLVAKLQEELGRLGSIWESEKVIDEWSHALLSQVCTCQPGIWSASGARQHLEGHERVEASYHMELEEELSACSVSTTEEVQGSGSGRWGMCKEGRRDIHANSPSTVRSAKASQQVQHQDRHREEMTEGCSCRRLHTQGTGGSHLQAGPSSQSSLLPPQGSDQGCYQETFKCNAAFKLLHSLQWIWLAFTSGVPYKTALIPGLSF